MSIEEKNQRLQDYRYNWMMKSGLNAYNTALLETDLFPSMKETESRVINQWQASAERDQRAKLGEDADMLMQQPFSQTNWEQASELYRAEGLPRKQGRIRALSNIKDLTTLDQWASLISFDGKTPLGVKYEKEFTARRNAILNEGLATYEYDKNARVLAAKQFFDPFYDRARRGEFKFSDYDLQQLKLESENTYGVYDPRMDEFSTSTVDAERDRAIRKDLDKRLEAGDDISTLLMNPNIPQDIREEYADKNKDNVTSDGTSVKQDKNAKQLEQDIYQNIGGVSTPLESKRQTPGALLAVDYAQQLYAQRRAELIRGGMNEVDASKQAYREVNEMITKGNHDADGAPADRNNPFNFNQIQGYYNMLRPGGSAQSERRMAEAQEAVNNIGNVDNIFVANGNRPRQPLLDRSQLVPKDLLKSYVQQSGEWTYEPPAIAKYISDEYYGGKISPWEVMERQAKFQLGEGGTLPSSLLRSETLTPEVKALLYRGKPSYSRTARAYRQMNTEGFDPSTVPGHYGGMIVEAAQANNIDPAVLSGLIEQESAWDPSATSRVGAQGLGQFMPETAKEFGVDVTDPKSSIDGAARYLRYLIDYFGGNQTLALYAYNGGMGNIERYGGPIPGNEENEGYAPAVLERATKYGYRGYVPGLDPAIQQ
jgi:hypothetical protein